jgi:hypothetical protein
MEPVSELESTATVNSTENSLGDDQDAPEEDLDIGLDDILDELPAPPELLVQAGDDWLEHEGQKYHKASLLRIIFCSGFMRKSKERLERVRDYTAASLKLSINQDDESLLGITVFMVGDLFTTLIRTGQTVSLAVLQSTGIDHNSHRVSAVGAAELEVDTSNIKLIGQVLHLTTHIPPSKDVASDIDPIHFPSEFIPPSTAPSDTEVPAASAINSNKSLIWNGDYIKYNALKAKKGLTLAPSRSTKVVSRNALLFSIPSTFTNPVTGTLIGTAEISDMNNQALASHGLHETWEFDLSILQGIAASLWSKAEANSWKLLELGKSFNDAFPYVVNQGAPSLVCLKSPSHISAKIV